MRTRCFLIALTVLIVACQRNESTTETAAATPTATKTSTAPQPVTINQGLQTPESVLWDPQQDVYFISNINGPALAVDNNGYISRVNPDTMQVDVKWIEGGKPGVTLDAPKGMAIVGDTLYVADITSVRKFDRKSGAPKGDIKIPGSTFLNDLAGDGIHLTTAGALAYAHTIANALSDP